MKCIGKEVIRSASSNSLHAPRSEPRSAAEGEEGEEEAKAVQPKPNPEGEEVEDAERR